MTLGEYYGVGLRNAVESLLSPLLRVMTCISLRHQARLFLASICTWSHLLAFMNDCFQERVKYSNPLLGVILVQKRGYGKVVVVRKVVDIQNLN